MGDEVPVHFIRFFPQYKMLDTPPTSIEFLETAWKIAKEEGLKYVYIGNVPGHPKENTYCPKCGKLLIRRFGYLVEKKFKDGKCECGERIPGVWK